MRRLFRSSVLLFVLPLVLRSGLGQVPGSSATPGGFNAATPAASPSAPIDALLAGQPAATRAHWGISLIDAATGATLYAKNDAQLFEPASNAKLFTTSTALALLGPTYTMNTRVLAEGMVDAGGTLHGSLRLLGGGDPTMSGRVYPYAGRTDRSNPPLTALSDLAGQVLASGIKAVDGGVIADDTLFPDERYGAGWGWDDLQWEYGAPVSALVVNDNVHYLTVTPGASQGAPVTAAWLPDLTAGLAPEQATAIDSLLVQAVTSAAATAPALGITGVPDVPGRLRLYGTLPAAGAPAHLALSVQSPAHFAGEAFASALNAEGIHVSGGVSIAERPSEDTRSFLKETTDPLTLRALPPGASSLSSGSVAFGEGKHDSAALSAASSSTSTFRAGSLGRLVAVRQSVPLAQIVTVTNKVSQNLHAEILLRLLGLEEGMDGSAAQGARVVRSFLTQDAGVAPEDFVFYDGSGLSTKDLVTPRAITTLLRYSTTQPWGALLRESLPMAGVDGSLQARLPALRGRVQAKTGTLGEVDALSGFLTAASGRTLIFSILCNNYAGIGSRPLVDALVTAAAQSF